MTIHGRNRRPSFCAVQLQLDLFGIQTRIENNEIFSVRGVAAVVSGLPGRQRG